MGRKGWRLGSWADPGALGQHGERGVGQCNANFFHSFICSGACFRPGEPGRGCLLEEGRGSIAKGVGPPLPPDGLQASQRSGRKELRPVCASGLTRPRGWR